MTASSFLFWARWHQRLTDRHIFPVNSKHLLCRVFIVRKPDGYGHKAIVRDPIHYEFTGDQKLDDYNVTLKMTQEVEKIIKEYPDNWLWFQHRWNTPYTPQEEEKQPDEK